MAVLKKIQASTLMETLVATILIVLIFMIASMSLNNIFSNSIRYSTTDIEAYLNELEYLNINEKLLLPYNEAYKNWNISIDSERIDSDELLLTAINKKTQQIITKQID